MAKKLEVSKLSIGERDVNVLVDNMEFLQNKLIQPEGRMLADSDHLAFVYILDVEDDFVYVSFPERIWDELNRVLKQHLPLFLSLSEDKRVPLTQFEEELQYLISNIEENSNYGKGMVHAVSKAFVV
ncbi:hypothetical protein H1D32_23410 [Anaerobacillus sp. CMMVII]|uniref:UPF0738 family protein n=1 Tax=Anaerobacillus sp. CMMVII TaxID=2755588 RepID=UPI0021B7A65A|nr:hypothetical protein [Anaerobacillus sp. CMMVII]MCT8140384.1 hypothetical protein [Anaerobacillus sp. CMMVII]